MKRSPRFVIGFLAIAAIVSGVFVTQSPTLMGGDPIKLQPDKSEIQAARDFSKAFRTVAKNLKPAVVSVHSETTLKTTSSGRSNPWVFPDDGRFNLEDFFGGDIWSRFRDLDRFRDFEKGKQPNVTRKSIGSGVIVRKDGVILTNNHVIRGADKISVRLHDGRTATAKILGTDPKSDLAVLKIKGENYAYAKLEGDDQLEVGDWVLALGSPFGLEQTVTAGIVSAERRTGIGIADYEDFIQTDAAINVGNSGGPLVNLKGEVVGINTAIASNNRRFQGVGFAIPARIARRVMDSILEHGTVQRGRIGAAVQTLTQELSQSFNYRGTGGVLVSDVMKDSPAERAGLKPEDIVIAIDGKKLHRHTELVNAIAFTRPGKKVTLRVWRRGKTFDLPMEVGQAKETTTTLKPIAPSGATDDSELGMSLRKMDADWAKQKNLPADLEGVYVERVAANGIGAQMGLRAGDVIVSLQGEAVKSVEDVRRRMTKQTLRDGIRARVHRQGAKVFLFLQRN